MPYGYGYGFYGFDPYYLMLVVPALLFALWAQFKVNSTYSRYSQVPGHRGYTGADVAKRILSENGIYDVSVEMTGGNLTDHFDPRAKVIRLSQGVYSSNSVAALGIAAHEAGHAVQHAKHYSPLIIRNTIIPVCSIGSNLAVPLVFIGFIFPAFSGLIIWGIIGFALAALFQLITLPVEFNASRRAIASLSNGYYLDEFEIAGTKKVLTAAALTYVAALAVSLANLLRIVMLFNRRRD